MSWKTCQHCGTELTGAGLDSDRDTCFRCFELFEEKGGPQLDPETHPRTADT